MTYLNMAYGLCFLLGLGLPLWVVALLYKEKFPLYKGVAIYSLGWVIASSLLAYSGLLSDFSTLPPKMFIVIIIPLVSAFIFAFHPKTKVFLNQIPAAWLIGFQAFRVPVEIMLWLLFMAEIFPIQLTFEGRNFDVITGLTAIPMAWWVSKNPDSKMGVVLWNILGLGLLINVVVTAVLSMPTPFQYFTNQPDNRMVAEFPLVLLPAVMVAFAYTFHILSLRQVFLTNTDQ